VTAEDLAALHPRLFHVTQAGCVDGILAHGLLSTSLLLDLFEVDGPARAALEAERRPARVRLEHPRHGQAVLGDNTPLSGKALSACLDDDLSPADWLRMLNARAFFWPDEDGASTLISARLNRGRALAVLVIDTLAIVRAHAPRVELCPINSGSTIRKAARRGRVTFTPMHLYPYRVWRRQRGGLDRIREVVVRDGVMPIAPHVIEVRQVVGG
jgi:hypothetical protein